MRNFRKKTHVTLHLEAEHVYMILPLKFNIGPLRNRVWKAKYFPCEIVRWAPTSFFSRGPQLHLSNEKNLGWLGYIGDYTIHLYGDYNKLL